MQKKYLYKIGLYNTVQENFSEKKVCTVVYNKKTKTEIHCTKNN
ncbi:hypothetical protein T190115A13A_50052 [Tenacibaculum sp. 190524A02b]|uniref:Uncharacterized protein n=1 Tax=Tenacibaculum vairaonense TaxID=3137860 RepID=A0ABP1FBU1_9FLAO